MRRAAPALLALLLAASGCAVRPVVMDPPEYAAYRQTRIATTLEERLSNGFYYVKTYPEGYYAAQVSEFLSKAEPLYYASSRTTIKGLEGYLLTLPSGPHAREAAERLRDLRAQKDARSAGLTGDVKAMDAELARETERRRAVGDRLKQWLSLFLDPAVFNAPMADSKKALIVPWSLALPWPVCTHAGADPDMPKGPPGAARRCTKLLQFDYRAVEDGEPQERQALVEIAMWQDEDGRPMEVTLGGPELFLRLHEAASARVADLTDPDAALHGAERAVEIARGAFESSISPEPACKQSAESDVLRLTCKGMDLRVLASSLSGEDDRFIIRPAR